MSKTWVDTHFHVFNAGIAVEGARYVPDYNALLSDWMRQAKSAGITHGVWVQPSFLGTDNSLMRHALEAHPEMLRGIVVIKPDTSLEALTAWNQVGVRGIRLNLAGTAHEIPEWTRADALWEAMCDLGWHLEIHTDQGKLPHVLGQLPTQLPLVVDHMGKPMHASASDPTLLALKKRAEIAPLFVKLSGAYRLGSVDSGTLAKVLCQELGPGALLWGSDWPCTNHEQFANVEQLVLQAQAWIPAEFLDQVMSRNPLQLYWGTS